MKTSTSPRATRASETILTDSVLANAPVGSKPFVGTLSWESGFGVCIGTVRKFYIELRVWRFTPDFQWDGQAWPWAVDLVEYAEDRETVLGIKERRLFKTEGEARAEGNRWAAEIRAHFGKDGALLATEDGQKALSKSNQEDLMRARLKVWRELYPDTFKALDNLGMAEEAERPGKIEAAFRAYAVDRVRLDKLADVGEITRFESVPTDMGFILEIAKAYEAKSPHDPVDVEIAANWFAAGYDKMSLAEYTDAINSKTSAKLKPEAMKARRLKKLRLLSSRAEGRPEKS